MADGDMVRTQRQRVQNTRQREQDEENALPPSTKQRPVQSRHFRTMPSATVPVNGTP